jgi:MHS family proline/betaine transporter-like MFS transporter
MDKNKKYVFASAISGNILEYYDFTVYSVFASSLGDVFFPTESRLVQVIYSLAVFAVGFLTRPIGGIVFGYIGDHYGRRRSLIISMLGMTLTTFSIGLIPGYDSIGIAAPIILIILRLTQGLCISGEGAGAAIFILEHFKTLRSGLISGIVQASNIAGTLLASLIGLVVHRYLYDIAESWRLAFVLGGFMGIIGFYFRLRVHETPIFTLLHKQKMLLKAPFIDLLCYKWRNVLITIVLGGLASSIVYIIKAFIPVLYNNFLGLDKSVSLFYLSYTTMILMLCLPFAGMLSDYFGKRKTLQYATLLQIIMIKPIFMLMVIDNTIYHIIGLTSLGILSAIVSGSAYIFVISLFEPKYRFTGVAFSYNLGIAIFGGTTPIISTIMADIWGVTAPTYYLILLSLAFLTITWIMKSDIDDAHNINSFKD